FSAAIPRPTSGIEKILLRSVLLDVAFKTGITVHTRLHADLVGHCVFSPNAMLDRFWPAEIEDPQVQFDHWCQAFFDELNETHPPSLGSSVARLVKRNVRDQWTLRRLAEFFHVTPSKIR